MMSHKALGNCCIATGARSPVPVIGTQDEQGVHRIGLTIRRGTGSATGRPIPRDAVEAVAESFH
jgi:hypothetical protein